MHEMPISTLDRLLSVNLKAIFVSGQVIFPYFMENNIKGAMVNTIRYVSHDDCYACLIYFA